jgi:hypothetical protein
LSSCRSAPPPLPPRSSSSTRGLRPPDADAGRAERKHPRRPSTAELTAMVTSAMIPCASRVKVAEVVRESHAIATPNSGCMYRPSAARSRIHGAPRHGSRCASRGGLAVLRIGRPSCLIKLLWPGPATGQDALCYTKVLRASPTSAHRHFVRVGIFVRVVLRRGDRSTGHRAARTVSRLTRIECAEHGASKVSEPWRMGRGGDSAQRVEMISRIVVER